MTMGKPCTKEDFINRAKIVHGDKYDYSLVEYKNNSSKVKLICGVHGVFEQTPAAHLVKKGCAKCANNSTLTTEQFIERANLIHSNVYEYTNVVYTGSKNKVKIICKIHGRFEQDAGHHLAGRGCKKCFYVDNGNRCRGKVEDFIHNSIKIHGNKYDYSKVLYSGHRENVIIICKTHGEFQQRPSHHQSGVGCPKCGHESAAELMSLTLQEFIDRARKIHGDKFDYSNVRLNGVHSKVDIICPIHGLFKQVPNNHISGKQGCPRCKASTGERKVMRWLEDNGIIYVTQKKFPGLIDKRPLLFDFYLPDIGMCIEYDGVLHEEAHEHFGGHEKLMDTKRKDTLKNEYCIQHDIHLLRITYKDDVHALLNEHLGSKRTHRSTSVNA